MDMGVRPELVDSLGGCSLRRTLYHRWGWHAPGRLRHRGADEGQEVELLRALASRVCPTLTA